MRPSSVRLALVALAVAVCYTATAALAAGSAHFSFEAAKVSVSSIDGSTKISEPFTLSGSDAKRLAKPVLVEPDEVLRLGFTLKNAQGEKLSSEEQPHQVAVVLSDVQHPSKAFTTTVTLKRSTGKASWIQRFDRLPADLIRGGSGKIRANLLIGSFGGGPGSSVNVPLLLVQLPASVVQAEQAPTPRERKMAEQGFGRHEDHFHTFAISAAEQMPPRTLCLLVALVTLVLPAVVLLALWSNIVPSLKLRAPSSAISPFLASLVALELLAFVYWQGLGLTLFKMFPWLIVFALVAVFTGRNALIELRAIRLGKVQ